MILCVCCVVRMLRVYTTCLSLVNFLGRYGVLTTINMGFSKAKFCYALNSFSYIVLDNNFYSVAVEV
ncbi:hypothetical protein AHAS_Ahas10G0126100 [Arachis hypogaea]